MAQTMTAALAEGRGVSCIAPHPSPALAPYGGLSPRGPPPLRLPAPHHSLPGAAPSAQVRFRACPARAGVPLPVDSPDCCTGGGPATVHGSRYRQRGGWSGWSHSRHCHSWISSGSGPREGPHLGYSQFGPRNLQIPPDFVVNSQHIDTADVILWLALPPHFVYPRKIKGGSCLSSSKGGCPPLNPMECGNS